ncbi:hypothetical protein NKH18_39645 [Streptomyces sp. M10(2022)]
MTDNTGSAPLSGRVAGSPSALWHEEVLGPHFQYEVTNLLPWYIVIEKVLAAEYARLGVVTDAEARSWDRHCTARTPRHSWPTLRPTCRTSRSLLSGTSSSG